MSVDRSEMLEAMLRTYDIWMMDDEETGRIVFEVNCNDLWSWASSDSEEIPYSEIENCYRMGAITWACVRRGLRPMPAVEEDMRRKWLWNELLEGLPKLEEREGG